MKIEFENGSSIEAIDSKERKISTFSGVSIRIIPPLKRQNKIHKKKRINKKWAKRYGYTYYERIEDDKTYMFDGIMYMNQKTYDKLKDAIARQ